MDQFGFGHRPFGSELELQQVGETWKQVHLRTVISKRKTVKDTIREVLILPFLTTVVKGIMNLMTHLQCMNVVVQPVTRYSEHIAMAISYGVLKPQRGKIDV